MLRQAGQAVPEFLLGNGGDSGGNFGAPDDLGFNNAPVATNVASATTVFDDEW